MRNKQTRPDRGMGEKQENKTWFELENPKQTCLREEGKVIFPLCCGGFTTALVTSLHLLQTHAHATTSFRSGHLSSLDSTSSMMSPRISGSMFDHPPSENWWFPSSCSSSSPPPTPLCKSLGFCSWEDASFWLGEKEREEKPFLEKAFLRDISSNRWKAREGWKSFCFLEEKIVLCRRGRRGCDLEEGGDGWDFTTFSGD